MVMRRKEAKDYGTKKLIEGVFKEGDRCLIIEDVVTSGSSILETVKDLKDAGLKCTDVVVLLNRQQGGEAILAENGIKMHALLNLTELMQYLLQAKFIDTETVNKVDNYLKNNQIPVNGAPTVDRLTMPFNQRAKFAKNQIATKLFEIMSTKQTILCVAADLTNSCDILNLAEEVGPHICILKTHIDILDDFHPNFIKPLKEIAERHNFLLFEDRKFADVGKTVELQFSKGLYNISTWAQLVTAHSITGPGVLDAISSCTNECGVFLLAETSAAGSLIDSKYTKASVNLAEAYPNLVVGVVCQSPLFRDRPELIQLTPGVHLESKNDHLGQQYNGPEVVVLEKGCDVAVVGRGITKATDRGAAAQKYKTILWDCYIKRISNK